AQAFQGCDGKTALEILRCRALALIVRQRGGPTGPEIQVPTPQHLLQGSSIRSDTEGRFQRPARPQVQVQVDVERPHEPPLRCRALAYINALAEEQMRHFAYAAHPRAPQPLRIETIAQREFGIV